MIRIDQEYVEKLKNWFVDYVQTFKFDESDYKQNIILKEQHTLRVCQEILNIGEYLGLNANEMRLAEITALFHDIGRFEQYARYRTFMDRRSENHAELGVKILKKTGILNDIDKSIRQKIFLAVRYHNWATLPQDATKEVLFFTRLLRDADKLDIYKVVTDYYQQAENNRNGAIELDLPDTPGISEAVQQDLIQRQFVNMQHVRNLNDFKLLQIGWVYDINFDPTLRFLKERRYLEIIRDVLPKSAKIEAIFADIQLFLDNKLK